MKKLLYLICFCTFYYGFGQKTVAVDFIKNESEKIETLQKETYYLVQSADIRAFCDVYKVQIVKKYHAFYYIVKPQKAQDLSYLEDDLIYKVNDEWKLSEEVLKDYKNGFKDTVLKLTVHSSNPNFFKYDWLDTSPKSKITGIYKTNLALEIPSEDFEKLLSHSDITHIGLLKTPKVETPVTDNDITVNRINRVHQLYPDINGEGLVVSVKELLFDIADIDLRNRYIASGLQAQEVNQHATLIGTVIGGRGNSSSKGLGVAKAVTLTSSSFLQVFPDEDEIFNNHGISVQNHSYGTDIESGYGNEAAAYDSNTNALPHIVHVFSSGNSGTMSSTEGLYAGIPNVANQTGNFKTAKNIITVGAINRDGELDPRSSRGPAYDGRVKPELVSYAPGGTSDAAALVSGVVVLLQQTYENLNGQLPPSSLVKAALIAGSDDVGPKGIDFESGYGNLNAERTVSLLRNNQFIEEDITASSSKSFNITVPQNTRELKIALTWNDPAANPGDVTALVNDLDMTVTDNNTATWLPWVLNATPDIILLSQEAQRMEDHLNNVEFISIDTPVAGTYTIVVSGTTVTNGQQDFSIAYSLVEENMFTWTYPTSDDPLQNNGDGIVRWDSTLDVDNGRLDIRINNGEWESLGSTVDLNRRFFRFPLGEVAGTAQLRMVVEGASYLSEMFTLSPEIFPNVLFNCDEELGLGWEEVPNATAYNVRFLGERSMEIAQTVTDAMVFLQKDDFVESIFSVEPVFGGQIGLRGQAFDVELQGVACYFRNFNALLSDDSSLVNAVLNLSTTVNVDHVVFEKLNDGITTVVGRVDAPFNDLTINVDDLELIGGTNSYSATIVLDDGSRISTDTVDIFFPFDSTLILFPNPVSSGGDLNIVSATQGQTFQIVDLSGKVVNEGEIFAVNDTLIIDLISGIYILRILKNGKTMLAKKFIVN